MKNNKNENIDLSACVSLITVLSLNVDALLNFPQFLKETLNLRNQNKSTAPYI